MAYCMYMYIYQISSYTLTYDYMYMYFVHLFVVLLVSTYFSDILEITASQVSRRI